MQYLKTSVTTITLLKNTNLSSLFFWGWHMSLDNNNNEVNRHRGQLGQSLLNSMIGEYLEKESNPLAIQMGFFHQLKRLSLNAELAHQVDYPLSNKVVVFVHGLTTFESVWDYPTEGCSNTSIVNHYIDVCFSPTDSSTHENFGKQLQEEFGFTPFFLRYNTGLSLEKNGRKFADQLNELFKNYPIEIDDLMLVGFNMGGGLLSHTQYVAQKSNQPWLKVLSKCMYLGDAGENSLVTNILQLTNGFLRNTPIRYINLLVNWLDYRSTHPKPGNDSAKRVDAKKVRRTKYPVFLESSRHYFVYGDLTKKGPSRVSPSRSTLDAKQKYSDASMLPPPESQIVQLEGVSPIRLAHSDKVYGLLSRWVKTQDPAELKLYTGPQGSLFEHDTTYDSTNRAFIAGTVDLMASAYDKTVETVETMHYSIAEEPFYALEKLPIASQIAKPVGTAQRDMLDNVSSSLRNGGRRMHKFAANIATNELQTENQAPMLSSDTQ